ncbi:MAG: hypothetical protein CSA33_04540 [Desulfobulbus propionicus]|nr:MAG: hypothetical protein CSA33_04540 [Desulfobulbus propionicus]
MAPSRLSVGAHFVAMRVGSRTAAPSVVVYFSQIRQNVDEKSRKAVQQRLEMFTHGSLLAPRLGVNTDLP